MTDRFRDFQSDEKERALSLLHELVTHPGVIPPLLKGDIEELITLLPKDFFAVAQGLQLRKVASRKSTSVLEEHSIGAAKKPAQGSLPLDDQNRKDLDFLCYLNPALWYKTIKELEKISPEDAASICRPSNSSFLSGRGKMRAA